MSQRPSEPEMTEADVLWFLELMAETGIYIVVDGGWGVDALLGWQSRRHADLDIAVEHQHVPALQQVLEHRGFRAVEREGTHAYNFVLGDASGRLIDVHSYEFDDRGNLLFGIAYPFDSLAGVGLIGGRPVRCITPERMVEFHSAYDGDEDDYRDVVALCRKFAIPVPEYYVRWGKAKG
jgi:lincosamide nucleotidyltransferase A/C/D/E